MTSSPLAALDATFGPDPVHALQRLARDRYVLGDGQRTPLDKVLVAGRRAEQIADFAFGSTDVVLATRWYAERGRFFDRQARVMHALRELDLPVPEVADRRTVSPAQLAVDDVVGDPNHDTLDEGDADRTFAAEAAAWIPHDARRRALFGCVTCDFPTFGPRHASQVWLVSPDRGIAIEVYDDRGLFVKATHGSLLEKVRERFADWLLESQPSGYPTSRERALGIRLRSHLDRRPPGTPD